MGSYWTKDKTMTTLEECTPNYQRWHTVRTELGDIMGAPFLIPYRMVISGTVIPWPVTKSQWIAFWREMYEQFSDQSMPEAVRSLAYVTKAIREEMRL